MRHFTHPDVDERLMVRFQRARSSSERRSHRLAVVLVLLLSTSACDWLAPRTCTAEFVVGVDAEVFNSETGVAIDNQSLLGRLVEGNYSEDMERIENRLRGAGERAGTYTMLVNAEGFEPWSLSGLEVEADACHVITRNIDVRLTPIESM